MKNYQKWDWGLRVEGVEGWGLRVEATTGNRQPIADTKYNSLLPNKRLETAKCDHHTPLDRWNPSTNFLISDRSSCAPKLPHQLKYFFVKDPWNSSTQCDHQVELPGHKQLLESLHTTLVFNKFARGRIYPRNIAGMSTSRQDRKYTLLFPAYFSNEQQFPLFAQSLSRHQCPTPCRILGLRESHHKLGVRLSFEALLS